MKRLCLRCRLPISNNARPATVVCLRCRHSERMRIAEARKRAARNEHTRRPLAV